MPGDLLEWVVAVQQNVWRRRSNPHTIIVGRRIEACRMHPTHGIARAASVPATWRVHFRSRRGRRWAKNFSEFLDSTFLMRFLCLAQPFVLYVRTPDRVEVFTIDSHSMRNADSALPSSLAVAAAIRITFCRNKNVRRHANEPDRYRPQLSRRLVWVCAEDGGWPAIDSPTACE